MAGGWGALTRDGCSGTFATRDEAVAWLSERGYSVAVPRGEELPRGSRRSPPRVGILLGPCDPAEEKRQTQGWPGLYPHPEGARSWQS
jgi:hypothetical protein